MTIGYDPANAGVITFTFLDEDSLIARAEVEISKMTDQPSKEEMYPVNHEGEHCGFVCIKSRYTGAGGAGGMIA